MLFVFKEPLHNAFDFLYNAFENFMNENLLSIEYT